MAIQTHIEKTIRLHLSKITTSVFPLWFWFIF